MIVVKFKANRTVVILGTVLFGGYALTEIISIIMDLVNGYIESVWVLGEIFVIAEFLSFLNLWWVENGEILFVKKSQTPLTKSPLEDNLISLKQLYENGVITEEEYNQKKSEILNKI